MISYAGKVTTIKCIEPLFPEFPELLFGRNNEGTSTYFDASHYIKSKKLSNSVDEFLKNYQEIINNVITTLELPPNEVCMVNSEGHILIESSLIYLFISYTNPTFLLYIFDRLDELFSVGFTVSDTYLLRASRQRIPKDAFLRDEDGREKTTN